MWKMINYEVCGRGHLKTNIPCQDKTLTSNNDETYVIALADGAGSASHSHYGAETVVNAVSKILIDSFDELIAETSGVKVKEEIFMVIGEALRGECKKHSCGIKELASTLLVVAVKNDQFIIIHLGDGIIGVVKNDLLKVASKPENGEFSNSTIFITSDNAINYMKLYKGKTENISGFVIMSDGTGESFYHKKDERLSNGVKKIIDWTILLSKEKMQDLLKNSFDNMVHNNTLDDCSIALLVNDGLGNVIYNNLNFLTKCNLFDINLKDVKIANKRLKKYERIIKMLSQEPQNILVLAKKCYIKKKYLRFEIDKLEKLGMLKSVNSRYYCNIDIF